MISLADALRPVLRSLSPVSPADVAVFDAIGQVSAADVHARTALPEAAIALRGGYAVSSLDCVGASPHSPVWLDHVPVEVAVGDALPRGTDAILPRDGLAFNSGVAEMTQAVAPGDHARLAGHDLCAGGLLVASGTRISTTSGLLLREAGFDEIAVRAPRVAIPAEPKVLSGWLAGMLAALGCRIAAIETADLVLQWSGASEPRLALSPGAHAFIELKDRVPIVSLPPRFDGMIAAFFALALPMIEALRGQPLSTGPGTLRRKLTSTIGVSEIALFKALPDGLDPIMTGTISLQALAQAERIALVPPDCEGYAAGTVITTWALDLAPSCGDLPKAVPETFHD